ncbi:hypothetical protein HID58_003046 [Brassica napus]|uniref:Uncharacterized protein n=1 Tax=Brassica napus TaxID=3708 RepID=A0ABQ8EP04_BRANA|nr:hypothetical protein HID58_003046 [Brassica napus]
MIPPEVKITKATTNKSKDYAAFSSEGDLQEIRVLGSHLHQVTAPAPPICLRQRVWPPRIHMRMDCSLEGGKDTDVGKEKSSSETDQETKVMAVTEVQEIAEKVAETKERIGGEEVNESEAITGTESDLQEGKDWLTPTKVSKTPEKKKDQDLGEGSIISNSRFALLAPEDAKDGDILQQET